MPHPKRGFVTVHCGTVKDRRRKRPMAGGELKSAELAKAASKGQEILMSGEPHPVGDGGFKLRLQELWIRHAARWLYCDMSIARTGRALDTCGILTTQATRPAGKRSAVSEFTLQLGPQSM